MSHEERGPGCRKRKATGAFLRSTLAQGPYCLPRDGKEQAPPQALGFKITRPCGSNRAASSPRAGYFGTKVPDSERRLELKSEFDRMMDESIRYVSTLTDSEFDRRMKQSSRNRRKLHPHYYCDCRECRAINIEMIVISFEIGRRAAARHRGSGRRQS